MTCMEIKHKTYYDIIKSIIVRRINLLYINIIGTWTSCLILYAIINI